MIKWLERVLLVIGVLSLGYYAYVSAETVLYQAYENRELDAIFESRVPAAPSPANAGASTVTPPSLGTHRKRQPLTKGGVIGRVEIPRLGVSAVVRSGSDARTLRLAVGHIPGTSLPGEPGNVGLAGHRDTFFRRLRDIRNDDEIRVTRPEGVFIYRVLRTEIVQPRDVWVLDPTPDPALTLVTCFPFTYIGSAPQRFIVRAALINIARADAISGKELNPPILD